MPVYEFSINDFVCPDPTDESIAQEYMDRYVAFLYKKPKSDAFYDLMGGKANYRLAKKEIKDWSKEIKNYFPDMVPTTPVDNLPDEDDQGVLDDLQDEQ